MFNFSWPKLWSGSTPKLEDPPESFLTSNIYKTSPTQSNPQETLLPTDISPSQSRYHETSTPSNIFTNEKTTPPMPKSFGIGLSGAKELAASRSQDTSPNGQTSPYFHVSPESISNEGAPKRLPLSEFGIGLNGLKELTGRSHIDRSDSSAQEQPKKKRRTDTVPQSIEKEKEKETTTVTPSVPDSRVIMKPSELLKFEINEIRGACHTHHIDVYESDSKMQLIGKLFTLFPSDAFTPEDLEKFMPEQLRSICDTLLISRGGDKEAIINRILKYAAKTDITKNEFTHYAPVLPMTLQNQTFHLQPQFLTPDQETYGWKHKGHQSIQMGGKQVQVDIEVTLKVREEEKKPEKKREDESESESEKNR